MATYSFSRAHLDAAFAAISTDETRFALNHLRVEATRLVATDGHRLHIVPTRADDRDPIAGDADRPHVLVPLADVKRIRKAMSKRGDCCLLDPVEDGAPNEWQATTGRGVSLRFKAETSAAFPQYAQFLADARAASPVAVAAFNARYLRDLADAAIAAADASGKRETPWVRIHMPPADKNLGYVMTAVRFEAWGPRGVDGASKVEDGLPNATLVLMPARF